MRRLAAVLAASLLLAGCSWAQFGFDAANTRHNPFEHLFPNAINVDNVAGLAETWSVPVVANSHHSSVSAAVVGGGRVFVTSAAGIGPPGRLHAFAVADGAPLWTASIGEVAEGAETPALWNDKVIVSMTVGVAAFDAAGVVNCSGTAPDRVCEPLWQTTHVDFLDTPHAIVGPSAPTVAHGTVFVTAGFLVALRANDGVPLWAGIVGFPPEPESASGTVAVAHGRVYVKADNFVGSHHIAGFDATRQEPCPESGISGVCLGVWKGAHSLSHVITIAGPSIATGLVFHAGGDTFDALGGQNCSGSPPVFCAPAWRVDVGVPPRVVDTQAVANSKLFVTRAIDGTDNDRVFEVDANGTTGCGGNPKVCTSVREYLLGADLPTEEESPPTIANGVLFIGAVNRIAAFDANGVAGCSPTMPTPICEPLVEIPVVGSPATLSVVAGTVFVSFNGELHAYRPSPN
jgi:outer membrane protein assembly factor BamB